MGRESKNWSLFVDVIKWMTPDTFYSGQQNSKIKHPSKITDEVSFFDVTGDSQMGGRE